MDVLVLGSGAREHAIAWKLTQSEQVGRIYTAPGNAGTTQVGENLGDVDPLDFPAVERACTDNHIDLVIVGPEEPLTKGIVDYLADRHIPTFGPCRQAAMLEASKCYMKTFTEKHGIPTAEAKAFSPGQQHDFESYVRSLSGTRVIKKNGLAAGKGVLVSNDPDVLAQFGNAILQDDTLLVEEFLEGVEVSVFAASDGRHHLLLPPCADYKRAHDGDTGPNTGGMGSICPVPTVDDRLMNRIRVEIVEPTFRAIDQEGFAYRGILYFGLMVTPQGPKVLEYNVRFGDPETQALLPVLDTDLGRLAFNVVHGTLDQEELSVPRRCAVAVVVAASGYPDRYQKGIPVQSIPDLSEEDVVVFHASTRRDTGGTVTTGGGRCFSVVGIADDFPTARSKSYDVLPRLRFDGAWYRRDIGISGRNNA